MLLPAGTDAPSMRTVMQTPRSQREALLRAADALLVTRAPTAATIASATIQITAVPLRKAAAQARAWLLA
ncbi:hypothetical protein, partial [Bordetella pertussis]|uniref:hypothetical protein n=1 Tax=Bordetella pertussis TaxID=520 RepID=UPI003879EB17